MFLQTPFVLDQISVGFLKETRQSFLYDTMNSQFQYITYSCSNDERMSKDTRNTNVHPQHDRISNDNCRILKIIHAMDRFRHYISYLIGIIKEYCVLYKLHTFFYMSDSSMYYGGSTDLFLTL